MDSPRRRQAFRDGQGKEWETTRAIEKGMAVPELFRCDFPLRTGTSRWIEGFPTRPRDRYPASFKPVSAKHILGLGSVTVEKENYRVDSVQPRIGIQVKTLARVAGSPQMVRLPGP